MKILTRAVFETAMRDGRITIHFGWGTGTVFNFLGVMEGEKDILFKVRGL